MTETYKLDCFACGRTVILPPRDGEQLCPLCGAVLRIEWNAERRQVVGRAE